MHAGTKPPTARRHPGQGRHLAHLPAPDKKSIRRIHERAYAYWIFYKYDPLANVIVKNNPFWILFSNVAWRKVEKLTPGTSRHWLWRSSHPAIGNGGKLPPAVAIGCRWVCDIEAWRPLHDQSKEGCLFLLPCMHVRRRWDAIVSL
jgi:hypothetical protein